MESRVLFSSDFLNSYEIDEKDILSDLENDVKQLEESYIEPTVIIISSLGFTTVSIPLCPVDQPLPGLDFHPLLLLPCTLQCYRIKAFGFTF